MATGYDYSSWRPSSAGELSGAQFVCRYLSPSDWKNLSLSEAQTLTSWGKFIVANWESNGLGGDFAQGVADATAAVVLATAAGWPGGDRPIYFSIDENVNPADMDGYFNGIASVLPKAQIGIYGEAAIIERWRSFGAGWGWLTMSDSWEGGDNISGCQLQQTGTDPSNNYDYNISLAADYGGWQVGGNTTGSTIPVSEEDPMIIQAKSDSTGLVLLQWPQGSNPVAVQILQFYYDGAYGTAPTLRVDLGLLSGPWVIEEKDWVGQRFVYRIPEEFVHNIFAVSAKATAGTAPFSVMGC